MTSIKTAQELWDRIIAEKVFKPQDYDEDLVDGLRAELDIGDGDFRTGLAGFSAQRLIEAVFTVVTPVVVMVTDLLRLFEAIGAKQTSEANLRMRFNFDPHGCPLDIDLTTFREWEACLSRILSTRRFQIWEQRPAWDLVRAIEQGLAQDERPDLAQARSQYPATWPPLNEPAPTSGIEDLDSRITAAWELRESFITSMSARWPARSDYRDGFHRADGSVEQERIMVSDFWDYFLGDALRQVAERGSILGRYELDSARATAIASLVEAIDEALGLIPSVERLVEKAITELISLLSLPMWGKRHELYAAWVFTRIVEAIGQDRLSFVVESGYFSFDFKGVKLASFESDRGTAQLWTELRTAYDQPVGHGRTRSIQPDYRLVLGPAENPESTLLAVEVKQYRRSSLRNPADALADYTGGLPRAHVVLAAHGPVSPRVLEDLTSDARERAHVVRDLRPGRDAELRQFHDVVACRIPASPSPIAHLMPTQPAQTFDRLGDVRLMLFWDSKEVDLDFHAKLMDGQTVNYGRLTAATLNGFAHIERDIRSGPGPEVCNISGNDPIVVAVHAFTPCDFGKVGTRLHIVSGASEVVIPLVPGQGSEGVRWYLAVAVFPDRIETIEQFTSSSPFD